MDLPNAHGVSAEATSNHPNFRWDPQELQAFIDHLNQHRPLGHGDLSIAFLNTDEIIELHTRFLQKPTPTDVITFPGDPDMRHLGEICVCIDVALQQAPLHGVTFSHELALYLIHGWLHLTGLDDHSPQDQACMRAAEAQALQALQAHLPRFRIAGQEPPKA